MCNGEPARSDLLKDSEATLREVAGILSDLGADGGQPGEGPGEVAPDPVSTMMRNLPALEEVASLFFRTYREIVSVMESIRTGRGILHRAALERVQRTHQKIDEVSSATEVAASGMLDGLDRALSLVDEMVPGGTPGETGDAVPAVAAATPAPSPKCRAIQDQLREELHSMISILQFQDITAQQLSYASGVLKDVEDRLASLMELFAVHGLIAAGGEDMEEEDGPDIQGPIAFDPAASTEGADDRQALADEIFFASP